MARFTKTPLPPGSLSRPETAAPTDAVSEESGLVYLEFPDDALDAPTQENVRVLPPTSKIQHRLREKAGLATPEAARSVDFDATERATFGKSSTLVKKVPAGVTTDSADADDYKSAVISNDEEIISQG